MSSGNASDVPKTFHVHARAIDAQEGRFTLEGAPRIEHPERAAVILLADPFSFPTKAFLDLFQERYPGLPVVGGMASGASAPGGNRLFTRDETHRHGALAIVVEGSVGVRPVVSQGCRPVGEPFVVTDTKDNVVKSLGGKPAAAVLREMLEGLSVEEGRLFRTGPFLGFAVDASKSEFSRSDFLVRGILGVDLKAGAFAVSDSSVRRGTTVQFLVRDAASAGEDLSHAIVEHGGGPIADGTNAGALLFSCNGRGSRMFKAADHDISLVRKGLGRAIPTAGFFAMGEVGPVGTKNFLHGFTASVALFRERGEESRRERGEESRRERGEGSRRERGEGPRRERG